MEAGSPTDIRALLAKLDPNQKQKLDYLLSEDLNAVWYATPGPQLDARLCQADILLYGGSPGGGKSDLLLGCAILDHSRSLIIRRQTIDLRGLEDRLFTIIGGDRGYNSIKHRWVNPKDRSQILEFGGLKDPKSHNEYQGRPHDFIGFDEGAQLREHQVQFVSGWLRPADNVHSGKGRRTRIIIASNPPVGGEGLWLLSWFAPWLDPMFPNPARPGELRWCIVVKGKTVWVDGPGVYPADGQNYIALSRTFIPAKLDDNPYLRNTNYRAQVDSLPEPLRTILLTGNFALARIDEPDQIIPSSYVRAAQLRWREDGFRGVRQTAMALDVAFGGTDQAIVAAVHDQWFAKPEIKDGVDVNESSDLSGMVFARRKGDTPVAVDMGGGYGIGVAEHLKKGKVRVFKFNGSKKVEKRQIQGGMKFANLRAQVYWEFREDLSPQSDFLIALPPDTRLTAEFAAIRKKVRAGAFYVESKDDIRRRLGSSPDRADAYVMAWWLRKKTILMDQRLKIRGSRQDDAAPISNPFEGF